MVGEAIRHRFPVLAAKTYVNSCSQGALSDAVRAAYEEYLDGWDANGAEWAFWVERAEAIRGRFAELLAVEAGEVALQTSVSAAVSALVSGIDFAGERNRIVITASAKIAAQTGIEMEALTAVSVAALTIYDMCKAVDKQMSIGHIHLISKTKK